MQSIWVEQFVPGSGRVPIMFQMQTSLLDHNRDNAPRLNSLELKRPSRHHLTHLRCVHPVSSQSPLKYPNLVHSSGIFEQALASVTDPVFESPAGYVDPDTDDTIRPDDSDPDFFDAFLSAKRLQSLRNCVAIRAYLSAQSPRSSCQNSLKFWCKLWCPEHEDATHDASQRFKSAST